MRGMAAHSRLRAHGLIKDNGSYLICIIGIILIGLKNGDGKPWMDLLERFESMMGREDWSPYWYRGGKMNSRK